MIAAAFALALFAQAAPAATSPAPPPETAPTMGAVVSPLTLNGSKPSEEAKAAEVVCHSEPVLGTLFPKKICAPRRDIAERKRIDQAYVRDTQALRPFRSN
jgi:hypothetical protein